MADCRYIMTDGRLYNAEAASMDHIHDEKREKRTQINVPVSKQEQQLFRDGAQMVGVSMAQLFREGAFRELGRRLQEFPPSEQPR